MQLLKNVWKTCKNGEGLFANDVEYSCSDDGSSYCVTKSELNLFYEKVGLRLLKRTIPSTLVLQSRQLPQLYKNIGSSGDPKAYLLQGGDFTFSYNIFGMIDGNSLNKDIYCKVVTILGKGGVF